MRDTARAPTREVASFIPETVTVTALRESSKPRRENIPEENQSVRMIISAECHKMVDLTRSLKGARRANRRNQFGAFRVGASPARDVTACGIYALRFASTIAPLSVNVSHSQQGRNFGLSGS